MLRTSPIVKIALLVFSLSFATLAQNPSTLKESAKAAHMRQLNNQILNLHAQMQSAQSESSRKQLRGQAFQVLKARQAALVALMKENPKAALTFAFSQEALDELSTKFPESDVFLEEHVRTMGEVEHWIADYPKGKAESLYFLKSGDQPVRLHFAGPEPNLRENNVLDITGVMIGSDIVVEASSVVLEHASAQTLPRKGPGLPLVAFGGMFLPLITFFGSRRGREVAKQLLVAGLVLSLLGFSTRSHAQASCSTKGVQNTAVLLVNFSDIPVKTDTATAFTDFFDTTGRSLNGYWQEASYGQASASGDVFGPFTVGPSTSYTCAVYQQLTNDVLESALAGGVKLQNYTRVFVIFPGLSSCAWIGSTSMGSAGGGCSEWTTSAGTLTASLSFLVDSYVTTPYYPWTSARDGAVALIAHEGGHQLGLPHSGTITNAPTSVLEAPNTRGQISDQGDEFTVMGSNNLGLYQPQQAVQILDWIGNSGNYQTVSTSGTYTLQPLEGNPANGLQVLRIQRGNSSSYLWVEYRQPLGQYDSTLANPPLNNRPYSGAMVTYEDPYYEGVGQVPGHTYLMDFDVNDFYWTAPDLNPGQTWTDQYTSLSISVLSASPTGLSLSVNYGSTSCTHANPSTSISPLDPSTYPGTGVGYTMSVTNNDSSGCAASTFAPSSTQPAGWSSSFSANSITLNPGQSGTLTMMQIPSASTPPGTYAVTANISNQSYASSASGNLTVMSAPSATVTVSIPASSYSRKNTVPITATVLNGGAAVSGASVTFNLITATGTKVTQSGTTGSQGTTTWNYKLNAKAPTGTYSVTAQGILSSSGASPTQAVTSNTVSFKVQ